MQETYRQMRERHQAEFDAVACRPRMFCAFSDRQLDEGLRGYLEAGYDEADLVRGPLGWFGHRDGFEEWRELQGRQEEELARAMADHDFAVGAYYYEACNHEYGINWEADADTLAPFGHARPADLDETQLGYYREAIHRYWHDANEGGWL